ncbi:MAG: GNAT family N-acetyltransferase [Chloroflexota bacterium]
MVVSATHQPVIEVRRIRASEWQELRSLRLEALLDSPLSYGSTHEREAERPDGDWLERATAGAAGEEEVAFVAIARVRWIGMARGRLELPLAHLIGVYVTPGWRRLGVGDAVSREVVAWGRERGAGAMLLSVSDWNDGARKVYESIGFVGTGKQQPLPSHPLVTEFEMRLELD